MIKKLCILHFEPLYRNGPCKVSQKPNHANPAEPQCNFIVRRTNQPKSCHQISAVADLDEEPIGEVGLEFDAARALVAGDLKVKVEALAAGEAVDGGALAVDVVDPEGADQGAWRGTIDGEDVDECLAALLHVGVARVELGDQRARAGRASRHGEAQHIPDVDAAGEILGDLEAGLALRDQVAGCVPAVHDGPC
jgi:hypothetical protein